MDLIYIFVGSIEKIQKRCYTSEFQTYILRTHALGSDSVYLQQNT